MTTPAPEPDRSDLALQEVVRAALSRYPHEAATVELRFVDGAGMWFTEVTPTRQGAARLHIAVDGDDLNVLVGHTWFEIFGGTADLARITDLAEAVFAGRVEESATTSGAFARIYAADGMWNVGVMHLPMPWRWRRPRRYLPYA